MPFSTDSNTCPAIQAIAFDPRRPGTIFIGSTQGIFQSTDEGKSWILQNNFDDLVWSGGLEVSGFAFDPFDPRVVVAIVAGGIVYRSDDGAASWHSLPPGEYSDEPATAVLFDPAVRGRMLLGLAADVSFGDGIWESLDGGLTFHRFNPSTTGFLVNAMALSADRTRLYATGSGTMSLLPPNVPGLGPPPARRLGGR